MQAWEIDRQIRLNAVPLDRRTHKSNWEDPGGLLSGNDALLQLFWEASVPGSGAPECVYVEIVESMANKGYDMTKAETYLAEGMRLAREKDLPALRALTSELLAAAFDAPLDRSNPYHKYEHPDMWQDVVNDMGSVTNNKLPGADKALAEKIKSGWLGQLAGGSFGTAIEGYTGERIRQVYGEITGYITEPETMNDDVVYELVFLDVFERMGRKITSREIGIEWVRQIPFGWSAEGVALQNLRNGILPPQSGSYRNPFSDWIGAQMRGMICGMLAPGWPLEAARLAHIDGVVSHAANGVYGEMYAAVLTALSFVKDAPRELLCSGLDYLPQGSEYAAVIKGCLRTVSGHDDPMDAWQIMDKNYEQYNWIHAYPNIAADILALWYCEGDMTKAFSLLARAGMDVDCNAGLVGNILGIMHAVPEAWAKPLGDKLETYLKGKEILSINTLAERTARLAKIV